jgi:hypothetical protein
VNYQGNKSRANTGFYNHSRVAAATNENAEPADNGAGHAPPVTKNGTTNQSLYSGLKVGIGPRVTTSAQGSFVKSTTQAGARPSTPYGNVLYKAT